MTLPWQPVIFLDIAGSILMLIISCWCAILSWQLTREKPDDVFRNYLFLFTLAIVFFAISRSFGHLVKQLLLLNDMGLVWKQISPFSGAVNSATFIVIFAFSIYFQRFQKVHAEIEYYKGNLEEMIAVRTDELEKAKNTLENILNNSNPINITGVNFDLLQANNAYYAVWPRIQKENEVVKCYESRPGEYCHTDDCPLKKVLSGCEDVVQEVSKKINGESRYFITTSRPYRDIDGKLLGMVESFQDITLRKQAEGLLIEMDRMKSEFISTAAHELSTPLSAMMGYTDFLRRPEDYGNFTAEQKQDFLDEVYDRGEALNRIVEDLLDIGRIESGRPPSLVLQETDLVDVLRRKVKLFLAGNLGHTFNLDLPENPRNRFIPIDRHRINQALDNLLNNAIKYSPEGKTVTLKAREGEAGWEISIADQGVGMSPEQLSRIFDKFYRADSSNTAASGLGLGMGITKQIIEAHGGTIGVESVEGVGTTVIFNLPHTVA